MCCREDGTVESLLPEESFPRLPEKYRIYRRLLAAEGLKIVLTPALLRCCITNFMQQYAVGEAGPAVGITVLQRLEACLLAFRRSLTAPQLQDFAALKCV